VVLAFIGKNWEAPRYDGEGPRIWDSNDYVRAELSAALERPILVLPVLVDGAQMVQPHLLPPDIRAIATRNAVPLRLESFDDDTENIITIILGASAKDRLWEHKGSLASKLGLSIAGLFLGLVVLIIGALLHFWISGRALSASIGTSLTTLLLILGAMSGAWMGYLYEARRRRSR
jgi:hypothetical protein